MHSRLPLVIVLAVLATTLLPVAGLTQDNVVLVIIDGARYSETLGDPTRQHIPVLDSLAAFGTVHDRFYNDGITYTSRAVPALWCGSWTEVRDTTWNDNSTQYTLDPSIFEYVRHDLDLPASQVQYVLKSLTSLWLPSFHPDYGPDYWPEFHSEGYDDSDVRDEALDVWETDHPRFSLVYLADVDHAGHGGNWDEYLEAIETADGIIGDLWAFLQNDPVYADNTVMMITNDHGRHDDDHDGFQGHGDDCDGCRHIMMFAIGPGIRSGVVETSEERATPDFAVTACEILEVNPSRAEGDVMYEIFTPDAVADRADALPTAKSPIGDVYPNPFNASAQLTVELDRRTALRVTLVDVLGRPVSTLAAGQYPQGTHRFSLSTHALASGTYFVHSTVGDRLARTQRITVVK